MTAGLAAQLPSPPIIFGCELTSYKWLLRRAPAMGWVGAGLSLEIEHTDRRMEKLAHPQNGEASLYPVSPGRQSR
jgi:hypothetical protein